MDLGALSEGWRTQRDAAAYGQIYFVDPTDPSQGPQQVTGAMMADKAAAAKRYRDI